MEGTNLHHFIVILLLVVVTMNSSHALSSMSTCGHSVMSVIGPSPIPTLVAMVAEKGGIAPHLLHRSSTFVTAPKIDITTSPSDRVILPAAKAFLISLPLAWASSILHSNLVLNFKEVKPMMRRGRHFAAYMGLTAAVYVGMETYCRELQERRNEPPNPISSMIGGLCGGFTMTRNMPPPNIVSGVLGGAMCGVLAAQVMTKYTSFLAEAKESQKHKMSVEEQVKTLQKELETVKWHNCLSQGALLGKIAADLAFGHFHHNNGKKSWWSW